MSLFFLVISMEIDYQALIPMALKKMYPDEQKRRQVESLLKQYGTESFHKEKHRVMLGVLYVTHKQPERLEAFIELACTDYRDLLCAAEYPYSSQDWRLKGKKPENYRQLQAKEQQEYLSWVQTIIQL